MNRRQRKKQDQRLYKAICELNKTVQEDLEIEEYDEQEMIDIFERIRKNPKARHNTLRDYEKYIVKGL